MFQLSNPFNVYAHMSSQTKSCLIIIFCHRAEGYLREAKTKYDRNITAILFYFCCRHFITQYSLFVQSSIFTIPNGSHDDLQVKGVTPVMQRLLFFTGLFVVLAKTVSCFNVICKIVKLIGFICMAIKYVTVGTRFKSKTEITICVFCFCFFYCRGNRNYGFGCESQGC